MNCKMSVWRGLFAAAALVACANVALADPTGDHYTVTGYNFPDNYGPTEITWDGVPEQVGGMVINEHATVFPGIPGGIPTNVGPNLAYQNAGEILQWDFSTANGGPFSNVGNAGWGINIEHVNWLNMPGYGAISLDDTLYLYLTKNGAPLVFSPAVVSAIHAVVGPHPYDPTVTQVIYFGGGGDVFPNGDAHFFVDPADTAAYPVNTLQALLRTVPINDVHFGILVQHVPEPGTLVLAGFGLAGLAVVAIRRRRG